MPPAIKSATGKRISSGSTLSFFINRRKRYRAIGDRASGNHRCGFIDGNLKKSPSHDRERRIRGAILFTLMLSLFLLPPL